MKVMIIICSPCQSCWMEKSIIFRWHTTSQKKSGTSSVPAGAWIHAAWQAKNSVCSKREMRSLRSGCFLLIMGMMILKCTLQKSWRWLRIRPLRKHHWMMDAMPWSLKCGILTVIMHIPMWWHLTVRTERSTQRYIKSGKI